MKILLVEDEKDLSNNLKKGLTEQGYAVDTAFDGEEGSFLAETENYDLIILDLMLPKKGGVDICNDLRNKGISTPVLILTAKSDVEDKVKGFNIGADDYLTKPFSIAELYARIKALLKRKGQIDLPVITLHDLKVDSLKHEAYRGNDKLILTPKEFSVLELLIKNRENVVSREMILEHVWDSNYIENSNIVDVIIASIRKKVDSPYKSKLIHTVYGVGFKLSEYSD